MFFWCVLVWAGALFSGEAAGAQRDRRIPPASSTAVKPVNVEPASFRTVSGTVTVRVEGVPTNPQRASYLFAPEFSANSGPLMQIADGLYFLRADNVPADQPYTLTVSASYNSTVYGRDGVIERRGKSYAGSASSNIPYGAGDYDFGVLFLDLR